LSPRRKITASISSALLTLFYSSWTFARRLSVALAIWLPFLRPPRGYSFLVRCFLKFPNKILKKYEYKFQEPHCSLRRRKYPRKNRVYEEGMVKFPNWVPKLYFSIVSKLQTPFRTCFLIFIVWRNHNALAKDFHDLIVPRLFSRRNRVDMLTWSIELPFPRGTIVSRTFLGKIVIIAIWDIQSVKNLTFFHVRSKNSFLNPAREFVFHIFRIFELDSERKRGRLQTGSQSQMAVNSQSECPIFLKNLLWLSIYHE